MRKNAQLQERISKLTACALLVGAGGWLSGCGSGINVSSLLSGIQASVSDQNGDVMASVSAQLDLGGMTLASINVPIIDPSNPSINYGSIDLQQDASTGGGTLTLSVNVTQISSLQAGSDTLPNGTPLPISGTSGVVAVPIGSGGGEIYVDLGQGVALLGVAMPFTALNSVGQYAPGVDVFEPFTISSVTGDVGIFTGSASGTTGLGLFVDLSSLIDPSTSSSAQANVELSNSLEQVAEAKPVQFVSDNPSSSVKSAIDYKLWQLSNQGTVLQFK